MSAISYNKLAGFEDVYLEDSVVIMAVYSPDIYFDIRTALCNTHRNFVASSSAESNMLLMRLTFNNTRSYKWLHRNFRCPVVTENGLDYGYIHFEKTEDHYLVDGNLGALEVYSDTPTLVPLTNSGVAK